MGLFSSSNEKLLLRNFNVYFISFKYALFNIVLEVLVLLLSNSFSEGGSSDKFSPSKFQLKSNIFNPV